MYHLNIQLGATTAIISLATAQPVRWAINTFLNRQLSSWTFIPQQHRNVIQNRFYVTSANGTLLYIPRNFINSLIDYLKNEPFDLDFTFQDMIYAPARCINLQMQGGWTDTEIQGPAIDFLMDTGKHRRALELQTGKGKTYCANKAMVYLNQATMIVTNGGLLTQWDLAIKSQTNCHPSDIYRIQGYDSIAKLFKLRYQPKIFLCSTSTLRNYVLQTFGDVNEEDTKLNYQDLPCTYDQFISSYGIGLKIVDEAHLMFLANTMIDLRTNVPNNIYLSATLIKVDKSSKKIFDTIFPSTIRYGQGMYHRYVKGIIYAYRGLVPERKCVGQHGYNHAKYEGYLLSHPDKLLMHFEDTIGPIFYGNYITNHAKGERAAVYFYTKHMIAEVVKYFKATFKGHDLKFHEYIGETDPTVMFDPNQDVLVTTSKSLGTGNDVKNLRCIFDTVSTQAETTITQTLGRLRENPNFQPIYLGIYDVNMPKTAVRHFEVKDVILKDKCLDYNVFRLF